MTMSLRVLIIDDDDAIRETLVEVLEGEGHFPTAAVNGADALAKLDAMDLPPDLILLDLMMPVKDGYEFRAEQRVHPRHGPIPVIVMSADPRADTDREVLAARSYLRKPFDLDGLLRALDAA